MCSCRSGIDQDILTTRAALIIWGRPNPLENEEHAHEAETVDHPGAGCALCPAVLRRGTGDGSAAAPYTWTVSDVPIGTVVTFTETGYQADGYRVSVTGSATAEDKTTATVAAGETPGQASFVNTYGPSEASTTITGSKEIRGRDWMDSDVFTFILTALDAEHPGMDAPTLTALNDVKTHEFSFHLRFTDDQCPEVGETKTYYYAISEENGGQTINSLLYSDQIFYVKVTLTNENGIIHIEQQYYQNDPRPTGAFA